MWRHPLRVVSERLSKASSRIIYASDRTTNTSCLLFRKSQHHIKYLVSCKQHKVVVGKYYVLHPLTRRIYHHTPLKLLPAPPPLDCGPCRASESPRREPQRHRPSFSHYTFPRRIRYLENMSDLETVSSFVEGAPPGEVRACIVGLSTSSSANRE